MKVLELAPNDYKHIKVVESGQMLADIFPNGFSVEFNEQGEIEAIYENIENKKNLTNQPKSSNLPL